jgi:hypothetical protein
VHHRTIHINHQPDAKIFQFIVLTFIYSSTWFGCFPAHHQQLNDCSGSLWFYRRIVVTVVLCSARSRKQHVSHHDMNVNPEAATAVIVLMMMGGRKHETCWAVNKRQDNKRENCCTWLVIYLNYCLCQRLHWNWYDWKVITPDCLAPTKWVCFKPTVWPDTCCRAHRIPVSLQCTKRLSVWTQPHVPAMYTQTNVGLLCCVGSGSNVAVLKGLVLRPLPYWICGFESHRGFGCLSWMLCVFR